MATASTPHDEQALELAGLDRRDEPGAVVDLRVEACLFLNIKNCIAWAYQEGGGGLD